VTIPRTAHVAVGHPDASEHAPFYAGYIARVSEDPLVALLNQAKATAAVMKRIPEPKASHRYAEGKWTVRDVVGHMADVERIMSYRALRIARGDSTRLAGFDENAYADVAGASARDWGSLVDELISVRVATISLFRGLTPDAWQRRGVANGAPVSVRALAHIIVGHERHHLEILQTRYELPSR
jgi:hypothetical protein